MSFGDGLLTFDEILSVSKVPKLLEQFIDCYQAARSGGDVALQSALPMRMLAPLMASVILFEVEHRDQITYRIAGENVIDRLGFNPTGTNFLDLVGPELREAAAGGYQLMLGHPCGYYMVYENNYESGHQMKAETLTLPLRKNPDDKINQLICFHADHQLFGIGERSDKTRLVVDWETNAFVDIGNGKPEIDLLGALKQTDKTRPRPPSVVR